jgi:hypothetical protein
MNSTDFGKSSVQRDGEAHGASAAATSPIAWIHSDVRRQNPEAPSSASEIRARAQRSPPRAQRPAAARAIPHAPLHPRVRSAVERRSLLRPQSTNSAGVHAVDVRTRLLSQPRDLRKVGDDTLSLISNSHLAFTTSAAPYPLNPEAPTCCPTPRRSVLTGRPRLPDAPTPSDPGAASNSPLHHGGAVGPEPGRRRGTIEERTR